MKAGAMTPRAFERELRRVFRRLIEPGAHVARLPDGRYGLYGPRGRKPLTVIAPGFWALCEARDLVAAEAGRDGTIWRASETGRAFYRRLAAAEDPFRAQHQILAEKRFRGPGGGETVLTVNEAESPLGWLRRRKGANGKPLLSDTQFEAGERLRRDFTIGQLGARVTLDWSAGPANTGRRSRNPAMITDHALAARQRFGRAMAAAGPGLSDILVAVCCHLEGLEAAEWGFGWPKRSGKLVLQIALDRLAAHYGLAPRPVQAVAGSAAARASD